MLRTRTGDISALIDHFAKNVAGSNRLLVLQGFIRRLASHMGEGGGKPDFTMKHLMARLLVGIALTALTASAFATLAAAQGASQVQPRRGQNQAGDLQSRRAEQMRQQNRLWRDRQAIQNRMRRESQRLQRLETRENRQQRRQQHDAAVNNDSLGRIRNGIQRHQNAVRQSQRQQQLRIERQRLLNRLK